MFDRPIRTVLVAVVILSFLTTACGYKDTQAQDTGGNYFTSLINNIKKTVVFIGKPGPDGNIQYFATGFLIQVQNIFHLVTAKHVVVNKLTGKMQDEDLVVSFNNIGGGITSRSIKELKEQYGVDWMFHPDPNVDVAMIPFRLVPAQDDVRVIPDNLFLPLDQVFELNDVFFLSFQPGIESGREIEPIIRSGVVSMIGDDGSFYLDAAAFPGNSGSPVFLRPSPMRYNQEGQGVSFYGKDPLGGKFIGIIGDYVAYRDVAVSAHTGAPRIVFEENTGLSKVWSVTFIQEIINSPVFQKQLKKILRENR